MSKKSEKLLNLINEGLREYRDMKIEVVQIDSQEDEKKDYRVEGYATTFDEPYHLYSIREDDGFEIEIKETVDRHAFDETDMNDVIMQYDHEGRVFARLSNNTLALALEDKGLKINADLSGTTIGRQLYEEIEGGYTNKMSIGFTVLNSHIDEVEATDNKAVYLRTIDKVGKLYDVSAVSLPANDFTSISARTICDGVIAEVESERTRMKEREEKRKRLELRIRVMEGEK